MSRSIGGPGDRRQPIDRRETTGRMGDRKVTLHKRDFEGRLNELGKTLLREGQIKDFDVTLPSEKKLDQLKKYIETYKANHPSSGTNIKVSPAEMKFMRFQNELKEIEKGLIPWQERLNSLWTSLGSNKIISNEDIAAYKQRPSRVQIEYLRKTLEKYKSEINKTRRPSIDTVGDAWYDKATKELNEIVEDIDYSSQELSSQIINKKLDDLATEIQKYDNEIQYIKEWSVETKFDALKNYLNNQSEILQKKTRDSKEASLLKRIKELDNLREKFNILLNEYKT